MGEIGPVLRRRLIVLNRCSQVACGYPRATWVAARTTRTGGQYRCLVQGSRHGQVLGALGDPTRRAILEVLADGRSLAVHEIAAKVPISRPAVSQHLKVLSESGLVHCLVDGTRRRYAVDGRGLVLIMEYVTQLVSRHELSARPPLSAPESAN